MSAAGSRQHMTSRFMNLNAPGSVLKMENRLEIRALHLQGRLEHGIALWSCALNEGEHNPGGFTEGHRNRSRTGKSEGGDLHGLQFLHPNPQEIESSDRGIIQTSTVDDDFD